MSVVLEEKDTFLVADLCNHHCIAFWLHVCDISLNIRPKELEVAMA